MAPDDESGSQSRPQPHFPSGSAAGESPSSLADSFLSMLDQLKRWVRQLKAEAKSRAKAESADRRRVSPNATRGKAIVGLMTVPNADPSQSAPDAYMELRQWLIARISRICSDSDSAESVASSAIVSFFESYISETGDGWIENNKQVAWVIWRIAERKAIDRIRRKGPRSLSLNDERLAIELESSGLSPLDELVFAEDAHQTFAVDELLVSALGRHLRELDRKVHQECSADDPEDADVNVDVDADGFDADDWSFDDSQRIKAFWMLFFRRQLGLSNKEIQECLEWDEDTFETFAAETFKPLNGDFRKKLRREFKAPDGSLHRSDLDEDD